MKTRNIFYLALAFAAMSCADELVPESNTGVTPDQEITYVQKTFTAGIEGAGASSKTLLVDGSKIEWKKDDQVAVLDGISVSPILYKATEAGATTTLNSDTGVASGAAEFYAFYPYRDKFTLDGDVVSGCYLNPEQKPSRGGFYVASHFIMSKADDVDNFSFKNLNGFIKVRIPAELDQLVQAIYIFSNDDEEIAGSFKAKWNAGEPTVEYESGDNKKPYVRAYNTIKVDGVDTINPLKQGDYYISILPTEFSEGLTLVLQMTDGTQLSKRTENPVVVKENQILPITKLTVEDFDTDNINYFVLWNEGFTFAMGGVEVNKTNYPTSELRTKTRNSAIDATSGLFFLTPSASVTMSSKSDYLIVNDLCVVGTEKNNRSTAYLNQHVDLLKGGKNYLLANLNWTAGSKRSFIYGDVGEFGNVTVKNCGFKSLTAPPFVLSITLSDGVTPNAVTMNKFVIEDSEFGLNVGYATSVLYSRKNSQSSIDELVIDNNVFYALNTNGVSITNIVTNSSYGTELRRMVFTYNTVANLTVTAGNFTNARNFVDGSELNLSNNLFYITLAKDTNILTMPGNVSRPQTMNVANNYYKCNGGDTFTIKVRTWGTSESVIPLSISPLSDLWDPANGKFGAYTIVPLEGEVPAVPVGAQRSDMDPVTAAVNSAAYGYETNDMGSL